MQVGYELSTAFLSFLSLKVHQEPGGQTSQEALNDPMHYAAVLLDMHGFYGPVHAKKPISLGVQPLRSLTSKSARRPACLVAHTSKGKEPLRIPTVTLLTRITTLKELKSVTHLCNRTQNHEPICCFSFFLKPCFPPSSPSRLPHPVHPSKASSSARKSAAAAPKKFKFVLRPAGLPTRTTPFCVRHAMRCGLPSCPNEADWQ
jgi:hypothetical protein